MTRCCVERRCQKPVTPNLELTTVQICVCLYKTIDFRHDWSLSDFGHTNVWFVSADNFHASKISYMWNVVIYSTLFFSSMIKSECFFYSFMVRFDWKQCFGSTQNSPKNFEILRAWNRTNSSMNIIDIYFVFGYSSKKFQLN